MPEPETLNLVAVQLDMVWEDKPSNHEKVRRLLADSPPPAGSLVVVPEMFETGFSMDASKTAQSADREGEALLRELAQQYECAVLGGVITPIDSSDGPANQAVAFAPDGTELVRYQKMQPFTASGEDKVYHAGNGHQRFNWEGVSIAPFICYDLRFPERFRPAAMDGAELIVVIACWPAVRSEHWFRLLQARSIENQAFVLGVNRCGHEPDLEFDGRSSAFTPHGECLFEADGREQVIHQAIDINEVRVWRDTFRALHDIRAAESTG